MNRESFCHEIILKPNISIKNRCQGFYQQPPSDLLTNPVSRSEIHRAGALLPGEVFLTQPANKTSDRSNPFLLHYPDGLGTDNGNFRFAL